MGKTSKWLRNFLPGKKDKDKEKQKCPSNQNPVFSTENTHSPISQTTPKEKKRWSFRRSSATASVSKDTNSAEHHVVAPPIVQVSLDAEINEQRIHDMAVAVATADAAVAAVQAAAAVIRLTSAANGKEIAIEEAAAIKIQSYFRSYLARKALCALKGLVKLQALVRGHLVRKQAAATLRCMQALVTAQARALAQRIHMTEDPKLVHHRPSTQRKSVHDNHLRNTYHEFDRGLEENIKIVEMDLGESNKCINSYSNHQQTDYKFSKHDYAANSGQDVYHISPAPSALTEMSPRAYSGHFEDCSFTTAQSSPQYCSAISKPDPTRVPFAFARPDYAESLCYDYPLYPSYMANTESSRAKARSQSAPKSRPPDSFERQPSRRRVSTEGRNVPRSVKMQRSSSHVGSAAQNYHYPWSMKLDRSTVSLKESECGSTSTVLTNTNYCRSLMAYDAHGNRY